MAFKIPEEKIAEIKEATDIVELISGYLTLKKRGKSYFGLCPFHQENTPSFSVDPTKQIYHCFGCHKGGNVITFLMDYDKMSFIQAVEFLAEKAGISLPRVQYDDALAREKESLYFANKFAAEFFHNNLMSTEGQNALLYLKNRGFDHSIIRIFGLGYALPEWDGLIKFAQRKSVSLDIVYKAGLTIKKEGGGYYDRFRGRVMIPIISLSKKVVGFGGRILAENGKTPKYINSPETPIYQKSQILFGLYHSRESIREKDQAIFVEGYTDLISLFNHGIKNAVATSGTALTIAQAQLIKRYTENIILLYDSDVAGSTAAMRGADIFLSAGLEVEIATLPKGDDPDSFIKEHGSEAFLQVLSDSVSLIKFKIETLSNQFNMAHTHERAKVIQLVLESVFKIKDRIKKSLVLKEISEYFKIEERLLLQQIEAIKNRDYNSPAKNKIKLEKKTKYDIAEENLVKIMIDNNDLVKFVIENITTEEIKNDTIRDIVNVIFNNYKQDKILTEKDIINAITDPRLSATLSQLLSWKFDEDFNHLKLLNDCIVSIKKRALEDQLQNILNEMKSLKNKDEEMKKLMKNYQQCRQMIAQLESKTFITSA